VADSYRLMAATAVSTGRLPKVLMVTSPEGEAHDAVAANFAASLTTLAQMVAGGLGVTLLPESALASEAAPREIAVRRFRSPAPSRQIGLAWRRTSARDEEFHLLGGLLRHRPRGRLRRKTHQAS